MDGSINIDDAATPGVDSETWALPESRCSWAGVVVPDDSAQNVSDALKIFTEGVAKEYGVTELHFTDIYSGRGAYKNETLKKRIEIFELMFQLFETFYFPVLYQTCTKELLSEWSIPKSKKDVWWDNKDIKKMGLQILCFRINKFMLEYAKHFPQALPAFVDEGLAKDNAVIEIHSWSETFKNAQLHFIASHKRPEIQLADFAAFCISRSQWCAAKASPNEGDIYFIQNAVRINAINLDYHKVEKDKIGREFYEWQIMRDRKEKGLPHRIPNKDEK